MAVVPHPPRLLRHEGRSLCWEVQTVGTGSERVPSAPRQRTCFEVKQTGRLTSAGRDREDSSESLEGELSFSPRRRCPLIATTSGHCIMYRLILYLRLCMQTPEESPWQTGTCQGPQNPPTCSKIKRINGFRTCLDACSFPSRGAVVGTSSLLLRARTSSTRYSVVVCALLPEKSGRDLWPRLQNAQVG